MKPGYLLLMLATILSWSGSSKGDVTTSHGDEASPPFEEIIRRPWFHVLPGGDHKAENPDISTLLISCIDFNQHEEAEKLMVDVLGLLDQYYEISLPGASLAMGSNEYPHWEKTLVDVIHLLEKKHGIKRIIFLDHRNCAFYRHIKGEDHVCSVPQERDEHRKVFARARARLQEKFPHLKVYTLLMDKDGLVENIR